MPGRVRIFLAMSLDGFIAGPNDEIDWLDGTKQTEDTFTPFIAEVGAMVMGRRTYDVVDAMDVDWPYGELPILVATHRELTGAPDTVRAVSGTIAALLDRARAIAGDKDVYLDGGNLARQGLDAGLVDHLTIAMIPMILGDGIPLFTGVADRHPLELVSARDIGGSLVELQYRPRR